MFHIRLLSIFTIVILLINLTNCVGYRILGIFPLHMHSHMLMFGQLMKGLAKRGHQVDVISTIPQKKPHSNYTEFIIPSTLPVLVNNFSYSFFQEMKKDSWVYIFSTKGNDACEKTLEYPEFQRIIKNPPKDQPYDLVITEVKI